MLPTDDNGNVDVPKIANLAPDICIVRPYDAHWQTSSMDFNETGEVICESMEFSDSPYWWADLVGMRDGVYHNNNVRIGVIDAGFVPSFENYASRVIGFDGKEIKDLENYHGFNVVKIINECTEYAFSDSIIVIDALSDDGFHLDLDAVCSSIANLVDDNNVDIINISSGFYYNGSTSHKRAVTRLAEEVKYAQSYGCVIVAAGGNNNVDTLAYPAKMSDVIGVGSIGRCDLAPSNSLCYQFQIAAAEAESCVGSTSNGQMVFADMKASHGDGLDFVAPGVAINLHYETGIVVEQFGSSFAAPILTSIVAREMNRLGSPLLNRSPDRQRLVREFLTNICDDLGIRPDRQGRGMPCWR